MHNPLPDFSRSESPVYIIGGGPSLREFDTDRLLGKQTIGCNYAYKFGPAKCGVCFFGDEDFFYRNRNELEVYSRDACVVTNNQRVQNPPSWLYVFRRHMSGLSGDGSLAWNNSSGAAAIHLALYLGARRVYLLGFDGQSPDYRNNWHDYDRNKSRNRRQPNPELYHKQLVGFRALVKDLPSHFPDAKVIQIVQDGDGLGVFPIIRIADLLRNPPADTSEVADAVHHA